ncbi:hypothetical protein LQ954_14120 [Sphingomonas sp. IC-11]|uniref:hypothetical protein n=1 Tax=Sphingomonas sp. IC-11 TaxID=2898528 RepID=UPI001E5F5CDF|nr:hypothetical protein [Sphingomonas sp. IC-11]MCD2317280.1 hypothetical protein [Sphingomonas sp. IC-11]
MLIAALIFPVLFLAAYIILSIAQPDVIYLPDTLNIVTVFLTLWASILIRNGYARGVCFFWSIWFMLGSVSLYAQNQVQGGLNYKIDPTSANQYYLYCVAAAVAMILVLEKVIGRRAPDAPVRLVRGSNQLVWLLVLAFPLFYAASIYLATGDIPIFSGRNVSAAMYEVDYGPLHGFGIFVTIAALMAWEKAGDRASIAGRSPLRLATLALVGFLLLVAAMDGRRALAIFALFGIILFASAEPARPVERIKVVLIAALALLGYVTAATVRTGSEASKAFASIWEPLSTIGTEYRDYVYGFVRLSRDDVLGAGYDWLGSTLAALTPSVFLNALSIDKAATIQTDSARILMNFWNVKLGILIGLPGELWFAYEWAGVAVFAFFGAAVYGVSALAVRTNHFVYRAILLSLLGVWATSVQGQSTVTFGLLLPLLYFSFFILLIEFVSNRRTHVPTAANAARRPRW